MILKMVITPLSKYQIAETKTFEKIKIKGTGNFKLIKKLPVLLCLLHFYPNQTLSLKRK
jgi:hypothetical protein